MVFISYAHRDVVFLDRIKVHLKSLESIFPDFKLKIWDDRHIVPGSNWRKEVENAISAAEIAILIVSADFLASEFITNEEIPKLLLKEKKNKTVIIPVIVGPCGFREHPILSEFQSLNKPSDWIGRMKKFDQEEQWDFLRMKIYEHLNANDSEKD